MAGDYAVTFDFSDNLHLAEGIEQSKPHHSEARELVLVLEDSPRRIVLQHLLVTERNHVVKHWRQDWEYEQTRLWQYDGDYRWSQRTLTPDQARGQWVQSVWQVDDSPRYSAQGAWDHSYGVSRWTSEKTRRPLPRREHTTRNDYNLLEGINRHTVTSKGWVHEQYNYKIDTKNGRILAHELGNNTYAHSNTDLSAAKSYWEKTSNYWAAVRDVWSDVTTSNRQWQLQWIDSEEDQLHYMTILKQANDLDTHGDTHAERKTLVQETLSPFLTTVK
jgi:hypothetical protein